MSPTRRALISVSDKTGLTELAGALVELGFELVSTGGTHRHLAAAGLPVLQVAEVTGFPEILDGRVKTLHPRVHGGILGDRRKESHRQQMAEHGIAPFDLVVVNLYPFRETVATGGDFAEVIEQIDIGGPCLIRAAAKNHANVAVVVDPADYPALLDGLRGAGEVAPAERLRLAAKAFRHTQSYDLAIAAWLNRQAAGEAETFPRRLGLELERDLLPRYGENPHQGAAVYRLAPSPGMMPGVMGGFRQLQGKELSYNNLLDADAARKIVALFDEPAVVIVKHNNPCGVGRGEDLVAAYARAFACDPISAFGSIIAVNREVTEALAAAMADLFVEVLLGASFEPAALERFGRKANLRLLACPAYAPATGEIELRGIDGGFLAQVPDAEAEDPATWTCATSRRPTDAEMRGLELAWKVARYTKSNAIVLADAEATVGVGAGQMSRVDSCRIAIAKAQRPVAGTVAASDAFFPFRDGLDELAAAGVTAVVQPGGSKRDGEIVAAAEEHGMAMLLTGRRHFRH